MINLKNNSLLQFRLSQKIWSGFAVMLLMLVAVCVTTLFTLSESETSFSRVVNEYQPRTLVSLELSGHVRAAAGSLGFYLLSKEEAHKKNYESSLIDIENSLQELKGLVNNKNNQNSTIQEQLLSIESNITKFVAYKEKMLGLAVSQLDNFPAIKYASQNVNPISREILQALSSMIASEEEEDVSTERRSFLMEIEAARYAWATVVGHIRSYMILGDESAMENVQLYYSQFKKSIASISDQSDLLGFEQEEFFETVVEQAGVFEASLGGFTAIFKSNRARTDAFLMRTEVGPLLLAIDSDLKSLVANERDNIQTTSESLLSSLSASKVTIIGLLVAGLVLGVILAWVITRIIVKPMEQAVLAMEDIAQGHGDLTSRLNDTAQDEIGDIARGFNAFVEKIQQLIAASVEITSRVDEKVSRLFVVSEETKARADRQQLQTEEVAENIREVAANVESVTKNAALAVKAASNANAATAEGKKVVNDTIQSIKSMADGVKSASDAMRSLTEQTDKIGTVVDVIKGIAEQTNLLALNAAIEAARAGEQGRGFAVVADEVRTLASRTQTSTDEIEAMIRSLQVDAEAATKIMEVERERASASVEQAAKTADAFEVIDESVSSISRVNIEIEQAAKAQQEKTDHVNTIIIGLIEIAEENAAGAQQTHSAANELTELETELKRYMTQFKV